MMMMIKVLGFHGQVGKLAHIHCDDYVDNDDDDDDNSSGVERSNDTGEDDDDDVYSNHNLPGTPLEKCEWVYTYCYEDGGNDCDDENDDDVVVMVIKIVIMMTILK